MLDFPELDVPFRKMIKPPVVRAVSRGSGSGVTGWWTEALDMSSSASCLATAPCAAGIRSCLACRRALGPGIVRPMVHDQCIGSFEWPQ
ncbi:hypothetical protein HNQ79_005424 [Streptomyces candidus]|uniref:Uncharacterized protein n=1 Tax=Streptomyces candidus TaxID=67283 RepID=A0A7X0LS79_9ACTN|nr:hypothetical protein [Streptomyces candidus]GHH44224.1 hypothetical protein GCM10018773_31480 [Streptomyces candidus]